MKNTKQLLKLIDKEISKLSYGERPKELYEPLNYIMSLGGKRLRPLLALLSYQLYSDDVKSVIKQALAVEVFHNFTLMHDDIMDEAPLRRGKTTVHTKWDNNRAILSGDVMLIKAYDFLIGSDPCITNELLKAFNKCATEVCEGQQLDMLFEERSDVSENEYLEMIELKTAVLLGLSLELGAILSNNNEQNRKNLREFGINIGIGFQLKDDLLDVYGDQKKFGKQVGGDIISNKKTFLLIKAMELCTGNDAESLNQWLTTSEFDNEEKVNAVTALYDKVNIKSLTEAKMNEYFEKGFKALNKLNAPLYKKKELRAFAESLINREN